MFVYINDDCLTPAKQEVADPRAENDGQAQPNVVRHKYQHETVANEHLDHVKQCL